jgi:hypothetical protein
MLKNLVLVFHHKLPPDGWEKSLLKGLKGHQGTYAGIR